MKDVLCYMPLLNKSLKTSGDECFTNFFRVLTTSPRVPYAGKPIESTVDCFYKISFSFL